jgi:phenol/toluene 2-monooxygenase (NADH) P0/A0
MPAQPTALKRRSDELPQIDQMKRSDPAFTSATAFTAKPCYVRVTGTCGERFVEFDFAIGDPELSVELVLQFEQFRQFCARHQVRQLDADEEARVDYERMKWRYGAPGIDH